MTPSHALVEIPIWVVHAFTTTQALPFLHPVRHMRQFKHPRTRDVVVLALDLAQEFAHVRRGDPVVDFEEQLEPVG